MTILHFVHLVQRTEVFNIYWYIERKCRRYSRIIHSYILINQTLYIAPFLNSIHGLLIGNFETPPIPFQMSVFFSTETIIGWYILIFIQVNMSLSYSASMTSIVAYFVSCCLYIMGICDQIDLMIREMTNGVELNLQKRNLKIKQDLCKIVEAHVDMLK